MSIRAKILLGCLCLTAVTLIVGVLGRGAQLQLGAMAFRIYDEAFMSMSYLRSAQNTVLGVARDLVAGSITPTDARDRLDSAVEDLEVTGSRAMSPQGAAAANRLHNSVLQLAEALEHGDATTTTRHMESISRDLDEAVEIFAGDGYRARRAVDVLVDRTELRTGVAIGVSLLVALGITSILSRAIVPSMRRAVGIAANIAGGRLDNVIVATGRSETGVLLRALATMQASIVEKIARIQALMDKQASTHAVEIASHHARFETALDNMAHGLCMFDASDRVVVHNERFAEMFGKPKLGSCLGQVLPPLLLEASQAIRGRTARSFSRPLDDGRVVSVSEKPMQGGGWVATYEDVTDRHRAEARLAHMARHDALTGLPNRVFYREHMQHVLARVPQGDSVAVLCLDLDGFKAINDSMGHEVGDALLFAVGKRLRNLVRDGDLVARLGGDDFVIVQAVAQHEQANTLAERLVTTLAEPFAVAAENVAITVSIGIALAMDGDFTAEGLLNHAELALDEAKKDARGAIRFFAPDMDKRVQERRMLEADLRRAVAEEQFEVYYQPLVNTRTGEVSGFEALVRWRHPARGLVSPAEFIPVAEASGLIPQIGSWVLRRACTDAMDWPADKKIAVNLSPLQFQNEDLAGEVSSALEHSDLEAGRLELEITESLLLQDSSSTLATLHRIRALGVGISMDDFGTGYSSLSYLRRFPFDKIKIDQSFIRNLGEADDCVAIVRAVVGLGRSLGMSVVAEGVETDGQFQILRQEGCAQVQGYLFSKPMPAAHASSIIERFQTKASEPPIECAA